MTNHQTRPTGKDARSKGECHDLAELQHLGDLGQDVHQARAILAVPLAGFHLAVDARHLPPRLFA